MMCHQSRSPQPCTANTEPLECSDTFPFRHSIFFTPGFTEFVSTAQMSLRTSAVHWFQQLSYALCVIIHDIETKIMSIKCAHWHIDDGFLVGRKSGSDMGPKSAAAALSRLDPPRLPGCFLDIHTVLRSCSDMISQKYYLIVLFGTVLWLLTVYQFMPQ